MGEGGIAVTRDGEQVGGGIVITPTDAAAADQLFTKLRGLLALAGGQAGITVTDEDYAGTTITTVHLGDLEGVDAFAGPAPRRPQHLVRGDRRGRRARRRDATSPRPSSMPGPGASLAQTERFSEAMAQAGTSHSALFWVDVIGLRGLAETHAVRRGQGRVRGGPQAVPRGVRLRDRHVHARHGPRPRYRHHPRVRRLTSHHHHHRPPTAGPAQGPSTGGEPHPMAVRIRLTRVGATKQPTYRLVVADSRSARDGRAIDTIGHYNPRTDPITLQIDEAKAKDWLSKGAQPSDTVKRLFKNAGITPAAK